MTASANPTAKEAQELFDWAERAVVLYQEIAPDLDFVRAQQYLRNAENWLRDRHYRAVISNSERAIGAVADAFENELSALKREFPERATEIGGISGELFLWSESAKKGQGVEDLYGLPLHLKELKERFRTERPKNIPQRGRKRVDKKSSRGPGRYSGRSFS